MAHITSSGHVAVAEQSICYSCCDCFKILWQKIEAFVVNLFLCIFSCCRPSFKSLDATRVSEMGIDLRTEEESIRDYLKTHFKEQLGPYDRGDRFVYDFQKLSNYITSRVRNNIWIKYNSHILRKMPLAFSEAEKQSNIDWFIYKNPEYLEKELRALLSKDVPEEKW